MEFTDLVPGRIERTLSLFPASSPGYVAIQAWRHAGASGGYPVSGVCGFVKQPNGYTLIESKHGSGKTVSMHFPRQMETAYIQENGKQVS